MAPVAVSEGKLFGHKLIASACELHLPIRRTAQIALSEKHHFTIRDPSSFVAVTVFGGGCAAPA